MSTAPTIIRNIARHLITEERDDLKIRYNFLQEEINDLRQQRDISPKEHIELFNKRIIALNAEQFSLELSDHSERYLVKARKERIRNQKA